MDVDPNMSVRQSDVFATLVCCGVQLSISEVIAARSTLQGWFSELQGDGETEAARRGRGADREAAVRSYVQRIADLEADVIESPVRGSSSSSSSSSSSPGNSGICSTGFDASHGQNAAPDLRPVAKQFRHVL